MKKLIMIIAMTFALVGCKTEWTIDKVETMSIAVGAAVAKVADIYDDKIPTESRNATIEVMNKLQYYIPNTNESFNAVWTDIASKHLDTLIACKKISLSQKNKIMITINMATTAIDSYCNKHEYFKQSKEYMSAIVHGFCTGFLDNFKPTNIFGSSTKSMTYDEDTYNFLMLKYCK